MRLAIIRGRYIVHGGAERFLESGFLEQLHKRNVDITLITREWNDGGKAKQFAQVIERQPYYLGRYWRDAAFAREVQKILQEGHFDLVQSHERIPGCHIYRAGDGVHKTWLALRARAEGWRGRLAQYHPYHRYILNKEKQLLKDDHLLAVIVNSRMVARDLAEAYSLPARKIHLIPNGVDGTYFHPELADLYRSSERKVLGIPEESVVLLHVGSGFARKGVARTLYAMAAMQPSVGNNVWLLVIGRDRHQSHYAKLAHSLGLADRVRFLGVHSDLRPWYGMADVFVMPTLYDPLPNAVLEALSSGLPVITTSTCGAADYILPGVSGWVTDVLDHEALTRYLEVACSLGVATQMRKAAREAVKDLTPQNLITTLINLYDKLRTA